MLLASFLMDFNLIMKPSAFSIIKGDNLVIGVSSVDSNIMNSGKGSGLSF